MYKLETAYVENTLWLLLFFLGMGVEAQPVNDSFANAIDFPTLQPPATVGTFGITSANLNATLETGEANNSELANLAPGGTLWWKWTPPSWGMFQVVCGDSDCESVMGVFSGTSVANLTTVAPFQTITQYSNSGTRLVGWVGIQAQPGYLLPSGKPE
jgi:hypothetical protein